MLYIISEIKKSLFKLTPRSVRELVLSSLPAKKKPQQKKKYNITPCCFGNKMNEEKRKTENSTDQKVSVFPESRELLTCFEGY